MIDHSNVQANDIIIRCKQDWQEMILPERSIDKYQFQDIVQRAFRSIVHSTGNFGRSVNIPIVDQCIAEEAVGLWWQNDRGTKFPKRLNAWFKRKYSVSLPDKVIGELHTYRDDTKALTIGVRFSRHINWQPGDYGDDGSCYWSCHAGARNAIDRCDNTYALQYQYKNQNGRCWLHQNHNDNQLIIFNCYGPLELDNIGSILAKHWNLTDCECGLLNYGDGNSDLVYINNSEGIALSSDDDVTSTNITIDCEGCTMIACCQCGTDVCEDEIYHLDEDYDNTYCEDCYNELPTCNNCGHIVSDSAELHTTTDGDELCDTCISDGCYSACESCGYYCDDVGDDDNCQTCHDEQHEVCCVCDEETSIERIVSNGSNHYCTDCCGSLVVGWKLGIVCVLPNPYANYTTRQDQLASDRMIVGMSQLMLDQPSATDWTHIDDDGLSIVFANDSDIDSVSPYWIDPTGTLAYHRTVDTNGWTLTHVPTGLMIVKANVDSSILRSFADYLLTLGDWSFTDIGQCEFHVIAIESVCQFRRDHCDST